MDVTGRDPLDGVRDGNADMPAMDVKDFLYLVGTRHVDDEDGLTYQTTRVLIEGDWLVAYRRLVLKDGTVFQRTEDGPIFVRDIARLTDCVGVGRTELELDGIHSTDPEIVVKWENTSSSSRDALNGDVIVGESLSKPGVSTSKSVRDTSDQTSHSGTRACMDQENLPLHSGVKRDGCARNSQQMSDGAQMYRNPEVKRAKVIHSRILPSESFMPRTGTKCHPPNLPEPCNQKTVKDKRPSQQALDTNESDVPVTKVDLPNSEQEEPRRPG